METGQIDLRSYASDLLRIIFEQMRGNYPDTIRAGFSHALDYENVTLPPNFDPVEIDPESSIPIPGPAERMGYAAAGGT